MLTLSLFRHAKSEQGDPRIRDADRPLAERGRRAAPLMGAWIEAHGLVPDLVLSSPSVRTRETCALAFAAWPQQPEIRFEPALYLATPRTLLARLRRVEAGVGHLMVVGHNPGLQALAMDLAGAGPETMLADLDRKLPTGGLVVLRFEAAGWPAIGRDNGRLAAFVTPRRLES